MKAGVLYPSGEGIDAHFRSYVSDTERETDRASFQTLRHIPLRDLVILDAPKASGIQRHCLKTKA